VSRKLFCKFRVRHAWFLVQSEEQIGEVLRTKQSEEY